MCKLLSMFLAALYAILPFGILRPEPVENAYMLTFQKHAGNYDYIALDVSNVNLDNTAKLETAIQAYCDDNDITLLPHNYKWLVAEGYISERYVGGMVDYEWSFVGGAGVFISLSSKKTAKNTLEITAAVRAGAMVSNGYIYEAKRVRGRWEVVDTGEGWTIIV